MKGCNSVSTPPSQDVRLTQKCGGKKIDATLYKQIVRRLMYLTATRPDIMYTISLINRYIKSSTKVHLHTTTKILHYLSGTINYWLSYKKEYKSRFT